MNNYSKLIIGALCSIIFTVPAFAHPIESAAGELLITNNLGKSGTILYTSEDQTAIKPGKLNVYIANFVGKNNLEKTISVYSNGKKTAKVCDIKFDFSDNSFAQARNQSFISLCSPIAASTTNCSMVEYPVNKITIVNNQASQYECETDSPFIDFISSVTPVNAPAGSIYFQVTQLINVNAKTQ